MLTPVKGSWNSGVIFKMLTNSYSTGSNPVQKHPGCLLHQCLWQCSWQESSLGAGAPHFSHMRPLESEYMILVSHLGLPAQHFLFGVHDKKAEG